MFALLFALTLVTIPPSADTADAFQPQASTVVAPAASIDRAAFQDAMRRLWEDHIVWTRLYIVSAVAGLPDAQEAAGRLLQNQADIGNAIKPFYGNAAGDQLTALLRQHILIAADLVTAAKAGNSNAVKAASSRWDSNADDIADFLSGANPGNWPRATLRTEMRHHLKLTLEEAQARLRGDWAADIKAYDTIHTHILALADMLSAGIVKQFQQQFTK
jgi:hypothetical protein